MYRLLVLAVWALCLCPAICSQAALLVTLGPNAGSLQPNTANQAVDVFIQATGGETIDGFQFNSFIGDGLGGSLEPVVSGTPGTQEGVQFTGGSGYIWDGKSGGGASGTAPVLGAPQYTQINYAVDTEFSPNGRLATVFIDTTGFTSGSFDFTLDGGAGIDPSFFTGSNITSVSFPDSTNALTISAVPEPATWSLICGIGGLAAYRRRRKRAK